MSLFASDSLGDTGGYLEPTATNQPNQYNSMLRGADIDEIEGNGGSLGDSFSAYATYGVVGAGTSAAVGIANSVGQLGNLIGGDYTNIDTGSAIESMWGEDAATFYTRHKQGVDAAGMLIGTMVPGLLAVKALRAAQVSGIVGEGISLGTGMKNADLVLGTKQMASARAAVMAGDTFTLAQPAVYRAYATGAVQGLKEAVVFDTAMVITNNQNPTLNPDELNAWDAMRTIGADTLPFTLGGAAIGGFFEVLKIRGALKSGYSAAEEATSHLRHPELPNLTFASPGDKLIYLAAKRDEFLNDPAYAIKAGSPDAAFAQRAKNKGIEQIDAQMIEAFTAANGAGSEGINVFKSILDKSREQNSSQGIAEALSGLKTLDTFKMSDMTEQLGFSAKTVAPFRVVEAEGPMYLRAELQKILGPKMGGALIDRIMKPMHDPANTALGFNVGSLPEAGLAGRRYNYFKQIGMESGGQAWLAGLIYLNPAKIKANFPSWQKSVKDLHGFDVTEQDFKNYTLFHELSHSKSNPAALLDLVRQAKFDNNEVFRELESLSRWARPTTWDEMDHIVNLNSVQFNVTPETVWAHTRRGPDAQYYPLKATELLADAGAMLVNPLTREKAAKIAPKTAELLRKFGSLSAPWEDTRLFYNTRTGEYATNALPGANDLGKVVTTKSGHIAIQGTDRTFQYADDLFTKEKLNPEFKDDYLRYSAQWASAAQDDLKAFIDPETKLAVLADTDLPRIERALTMENSTGVTIRDKEGVLQTFSRDSGMQWLGDRKMELRDFMQGEYRYNEQEISQILNISNSRAMGLQTGDVILMGQRDFTKPENFILRYSKIQPEDVNVSSKSFAAAHMRIGIQENIEQTAASQVLGETYNTLPAPDLLKLESLSQTDTRASFISSVRTRTGSIRDYAANIQRQVAKKISSDEQVVESGYLPFHKELNLPNNYEERALLSLVTNAARQDWYVLHTAQDGTRFAVRKTLFGSIDEEVLADPKALDSFINSSVNTDNNAFKLTNLVGDFMNYHVKNNRGIVAKKQIIAGAKGRYSNLDESVIYPPPHNLKDTPYFAFVVPREAIRDAEPQRYMIYGRTPQELEEKIATIKERYGTSHSILENKAGVFTKGEVDEYKKLVDEYDKGRVFSEIEFDSNLKRTGRAAEDVPNLDKEYSSTLDLYRNWTHRQNEFITRSGVELKYQKTFEALKRADDVYSRAARSTAGAINTPDTIYKDTMDLMLDKRGFAGPAEQMWKRVGGLVGDYGSRAIDAAVAPLVESVNKLKGKTFNITDEQFNVFNRNMEEAGFNPPFANVYEMNMASRDVQVSRHLNSIVRTFNNFVSTTMLSLDAANSIVQTISTPILLSPVIREARAALDAPRLEALSNLTSVVNPSTGLKEDSAAKLIAKSIARYWTDEGKEFIGKLQERGLVQDTLREWTDTTDFRMFDGSHSIETVNKKITDLVNFGKKWSGYQFSEQFSRYLVADAARQIGEIRGLSSDEIFTIASGMIDKTHGVYRGTSRPQLFNGVVGQAVGLYQTYMFNFLQNAFHWGQTGDKKNLAMLAGLQGTVYGLRSYPGFETFNRWIGESNRGNEDLYSITDANDPRSLAAYALYGLGSHAVGVPMDLFSRGDQTFRNNLLIPTNVNDIPAVSIISKAVGNIYNTAKLLANDNVPNLEALKFGLAHNGMNRPLQGIGNVLLGYTSSGRGTPYATDINYIDDNGVQEFNISGLFTRALGTKPLDESILMDGYFRTKAYQASNREAAEKVGLEIKLLLASGTPVPPDAYTDFALRYEKSGGNPQNFNAFWSRQMAAVNEGVLESYRREMLSDTPLNRMYNRMQWDQSSQAPWLDAGMN